MTSSEDDEDADVYKRETRTMIEMIFGYWNLILRSLPSFTTQIVVIFCVLPVSFAVAIFLLTAIFNFGIALIAQTVSSIVILLFLIPTLVVCIVSAVATSYILHFTRIVYFRLSTSSIAHPNYSHRSLSPPPEYIPKMEIEQKLKTC
uniref:Transmembrane protein n=1 Tax=Caenorhabditis tropicalis TaxID=1561998 RepID=A0A1I7UR70_9PELO